MKAIDDGRPYPDRVVQRISLLQLGARRFKVIRFNRRIGEAAVHSYGREEQYAVHLQNQTCSCGYWEAYHSPCVHAFAVIQENKYQVNQFIHDQFSVQNYHSAWSADFHPLLHEDYWDEWQDLLRAAGRPRSTRINGEQDERELRQKGTIKCGICNTAGHNKATCPYRTNMSVSATRQHI